MTNPIRFIKMAYWRYRWRQAYPLMQQAQQEYESLIAAGKMADAARVYITYAEHRRSSIHYAMKMARK